MSVNQSARITCYVAAIKKPMRGDDASLRVNFRGLCIDLAADAAQLQLRCWTWCTRLCFSPISERMFLWPRRRGHEFTFLVSPVHSRGQGLTAGGRMIDLFRLARHCKWLTSQRTTPDLGLLTGLKGGVNPWKQLGFFFTQNAISCVCVRCTLPFLASSWSRSCMF